VDSPADIDAGTRRAGDARELSRARLSWGATRAVACGAGGRASGRASTMGGHVKTLRLFTARFTAGRFQFSGKRSMYRWATSITRVRPSGGTRRNARRAVVRNILSKRELSSRRLAGIAPETTQHPEHKRSKD
jgi:hypothetical protein